MKVKQAIKKVSAVAGGAFLLGATVTGALAYDLSDYPAPFVEGGVFAGKIVVGGQAMAADAIAATSIVAGLQPTGVVTPGPITVTGGEVIERNLNADLDYDRDLDHRDLAGFQDRTLRWDGRNIRIIDYLSLNNDTVVMTNINPDGDEEYGRDAYLTVEEEAITYTYEFRDPINGSRVSDRPITINFLGNELRLTSVSSSVIEVEAARERFVEQGESVQVDGHTVSLRRVGSTSVIVSVDGQERVISPDGVAVEFEQADYFQVAVDSIFFVEGAADNGAVLRFGTELIHNIQEGQPLEIFGEPTDAADAEWVWGPIGHNGTHLESISAVNNMQRLLLDTHPTRERPALAMGERLNLPNNYASVVFDGYVDNRGTDIAMDFSRVRPVDADGTPIGSNTYTLRLATDDGSDSFYLTSTLRTNELYLVDFDNGDFSEVWYRDAGDIRNFTGTAPTEIELRLRSATVAATLTTADVNASAGIYTLNFEFGSGENLTFNVQEEGGELRKFGNERNTAQATALVYSGMGTRNLGTIDHSMKLSYGTEFNAPENQMNSDRFSMWVPFEQQEARILVAGRGVTTTTPGTGYGGATVPADVVITDAEAANMLGTQPLIIVGGPYVNTIASTLLGNPTNDEIEEMFQTGRAKIRLFGDEQALLVAGYTATDTRGAGLVLGSYRDYADQLTGMEVEVTVPNLQNVQVTPVN